MTLELPQSYVAPKPRFDSKSGLRLLVIFLFATHAVLCYKIFSLDNDVHRLAERPQGTMIQMRDGSVTSASEMPSEYRSFETIMRFVNQWLALQYTWGSDQGDSIELKDASGKFVSRKLPISAILASSLITEEKGYREGYLNHLAEQIAQLDPGEGLFEGKRQTTIQGKKILVVPRQESGVWDVKVISYLQFQDNKGAMIGATDWNLNLTVVAVPPPDHPYKKGLTPLQQAVYGMNVAGLRIINIQRAQ